MIMPLYDNNPRHGTPFITITLIAICVFIFIYQLSLPGSGNQLFVMAYGFIPARLLGTELPPEITTLLTPAAPTTTLLTSMFMHGDIMHLLGNMLFLWTFGDNIELKLGRLRFIGFYLACGLAAAFSQMMIDPNSTIPMIGASGAISGVLGAYLILFPKTPITVFVPYIGITTASALWVLMGWIGYQLVLGIADLGSTGGGVAFWSHIGGFFAGVALIFPFKPRTLHRQKLNLWEK